MGFAPCAAATEGRRMNITASRLPGGNPVSHLAKGEARAPVVSHLPSEADSKSPARAALAGRRVTFSPVQRRPDSTVTHGVVGRLSR